MATIAEFSFNDFQENTYVVYDQTKECIIIDPGCYYKSEKQELSGFIEEKELKPVRLINTHCHIDHILGNAYVSEKYNLLPEMHHLEVPLLQAAPVFGESYGILMEKSPLPQKLLQESEMISFGNTSLSIIFTPGHSPGSISFFSEKDRFVISGDVLFRQSIGRTDLPGGDFDTLIASIRTKIFPLGDDVIVYSGHGPSTTVGEEIKWNPFMAG